MIADDRGSQIADRKRSQRQLFPYNRERSQSRLLPTFRSAEGQNYRPFVLAGKSHQNNMLDIEEEILISDLCLMVCVQYVD